MNQHPMPAPRLAMTMEQFRALPRHPAYKYEYLDGEAWLSPQPKYYHARLTLARSQPVLDLDTTEDFRVTVIGDEDREDLHTLFAGAFPRTQPYAGLSDEAYEEETRACMEKTWTGGDGPWIPSACLVARSVDDGKAIGAIVLTLLPDGPPSDYDSYYWRQPPPDDLMAKRGGRPHLTWIFVNVWQAGHGVATALLQQSVTVLQQLGYRELFSTFLLGNDASLLWHWRNGFELLSYPFSLRRMQKEVRRLNQTDG